MPRFVMAVIMFFTVVIFALTSFASSKSLSDIKLFTSDMDGTMFAKKTEPTRASRKEILLLKNWLDTNKVPVMYVTGRNLQEVKSAIKKHDLPMPNIVAAEVGTRLYVRSYDGWWESEDWIEHLGKYWKPGTTEKIHSYMKGYTNAKLQERFRQNRFKISYYMYTGESAAEVYRKMKPEVDKLGIDVTFLVSGSGGRLFVDFLPINGSKGDAIRFMAKKLRIPMKDVYFSGDSGNDRDALQSGACAVFVGGAEKAFAQDLAKKDKRIHISDKRQIFGVVDGLRLCNFMR